MASSRRKQTISKKKLIVPIIIILVILIIISLGVIMLKKTVADQFGKKSSEEIKTASVTSGSISTTVTGSGTLENEESENITIPKEVELNELYVVAGDNVKEGDILASVNATSVQEGMASIQKEIEEVDEELAELEGEEVSDTITSGVDGRIKKIYAKKGTPVSTTMYKKNALMLISLDGYMAVDVETDSLKKGDSVKVTDSEGKEYKGKVYSVWAGKATVVITDDGTKYDDEVTVKIDKNTTVKGNLYIHQQVAVTGYSGSVKSIDVSNNEKVSKGDKLITLKDVSDTVNYRAVLKERETLEDELQNLITIYKEGAVYAKNDGIITSITESDEEGSTTITAISEEFSMNGNSNDKSTVKTSDEESDTIIALSPTNEMSMVVSIDESDILAISVGQEAKVTIDSLGEDTFKGTITKIDKAGTGSNGVTTYSATVVIERTEDMLQGMSASAVITIDGKENALLLPKDAVTKTSSSSYVYTTYDESTGELGGMVEVTVGISNGTYTEITEGLNEGDTVYYKEAEESSFPFGNGMRMPGGFGNGDMKMPSDFPGNSGGRSSGSGRGSMGGKMPN